MSKKISISAPAEYQLLLCTALSLYADAAYPQGGSECAQVARNALMDAVTELEKGFAATGSTAQVSRRLRAHIKSAIHWYCEQEGKMEKLACLEKMLKGEVISDEAASNNCDDIKTALS